MNTYEPFAGERIRTTAESIAATAKRLGETVTAEFNGTVLTATPMSDIAAIIAEYSAEQDHRAEVYLNSPEGQKAASEAEAFQKKAAAAKDEWVRPFKCKDEKVWQKFCAMNADEYGGAILRYAARWAHLMEQKIVAGAQLEAIAPITRDEADVEGISGFMYAAAVGVLSQTWECGEQLRQWHNHDVQLGDEGEKANRDGGVLNPALLRIS